MTGRSFAQQLADAARSDNVLRRRTATVISVGDGTVDILPESSSSRLYRIRLVGGPVEAGDVLSFFETPEGDQYVVASGTSTPREAAGLVIVNTGAGGTGGSGGGASFPMAHASTHGTAGSDPLSPAAIGAATTAAPAAAVAAHVALADPHSQYQTAAETISTIEALLTDTTSINWTAAATITADVILDPNGALQTGAAGVSIKLPTPSGLSVGAAGLVLADAVAGGGLVISSKVLAVGQGNGILVDNDAITIQLASPSGLEVGAPGLAVADTLAGTGLLISSKVITPDWRNTATSAVSLTATNDYGVTTTVARGDHWHVIDQTITPTWQGLHVFGAGARISDGQDLQFGVDAAMSRKGANIIQINAGDEVQSATFSYGISGWRITSAGNAEFNNVAVRGELTSVVFKFQELQATAGTFGVFKSASILVNDCTTANSPTTFTLDAKNSDAGASLFVAGDVLRIKSWNGTNSIYDNWIVVSSAVNHTTYTTYTCTKTSGTATTFTSGATVVDYGPVDTGFITISADGAVGASANITIAKLTSNIGAMTLLGRMGNLNGTYDIGAVDDYGAAFGDSVSGNYMRYSVAKGFLIRVGDDSVLLDPDGITVLSDDSTTRLRFKDRSDDKITGNMASYWYAPDSQAITVLASGGAAGVAAYGKSTLLLGAYGLSGVDTVSTYISLVSPTSVESGSVTISCYGVTSIGGNSIILSAPTTTFGYQTYSAVWMTGLVRSTYDVGYQLQRDQTSGSVNTLWKLYIPALSTNLVLNNGSDWVTVTTAGVVTVAGLMTVKKAAATSTINECYRLSSTGTASSSGSSIDWYDYNEEWHTAQIGTVRNGSSAAFSLTFGTMPSGGSVTERMRIHHDGYVSVAGSAAVLGGLNIGNATAAGTGQIRTQGNIVAIYGGRRAVTLSNGQISIAIDDASGWACGLDFKLADGTTSKGGFWATGGTNALTNWSIGDSYNTATLYVLPGNGRVGVGTNGPDAKLDVLSTTEQLRLSYADGGACASFTVGSGGDLTIAPSGGDTSITGTLGVSTSVSITTTLAVAGASALGGAVAGGAKVEVNGTIRSQSATTPGSGAGSYGAELYYEAGTTPPRGTLSALTRVGTAAFQEMRIIGNPVMLSAPNSAPNDNNLWNITGFGSLMFYLDETGHNLKIRIKYAAGTYKLATIALA